MPIISNFPSGNVKKDELIIPDGLPEIGREGGLEAYTWAEISAISAANLGDKYFNVGDTKSVLVNGTVGTMPINQTLYVFILGFNHNREIEGDGITFGCFKQSPDDENILALTDSAYNTQIVNSNGLGAKNFNMIHGGNGRSTAYHNSQFRHDVLGATNHSPTKYSLSDGTVVLSNLCEAPDNTPTSPVNNTLMSALPNDLRSYMKAIYKYGSSFSPASTSNTGLCVCKDYLSLVSPRELYGEDCQYDRFLIDRSYQQQYNFFRVHPPYTWTQNDLSSFSWYNYDRTSIFKSLDGSVAKILLRSEWDYRQVYHDNSLSTVESNRSLGVFAIFKI